MPFERLGDKGVYMGTSHEREILKYIDQELQNGGIKPYKMRKLLTIKLYVEGGKPAEIAEGLGVTLRTVQRNISGFNATGLSFLRDSKEPGNRNKLDGDQIQQLKNDLKRNPEEFGFLMPEWTAPLLVKHIKNTFKVKLSDESCRNMLASVMANERKGTPSSKRKAFSETVSAMLLEKKDIWAVTSIYLGIRQGGKNKRGLYPYKEEDLIKTPVEIEMAKIDLTDKARKEIVHCAQHLKTKAFVYHYQSAFEEDTFAMETILKKIVKNSAQDEIILLMAKSSFNKRLLSKITNKKGKRSIRVLFAPFGAKELQSLAFIKANLLARFKLMDKRNKRIKVINQTRKESIIRYLERLSQNE
ncbi:hypothetical protein EDM59_01825 [Brevibacillus nitrificans]|uniref:Helix-turn-helix domain-containing protein n=1 Tax=Brevibacillus nitrificans TaxID=651560 RepID=A0A3M8DPZ5_9BACL|nr:hypothetical protein EDM59_01825 [Brevibacillus nitrificans]